MKKHSLLIAALFLFSVSSFAQVRKILLEEYTGTWCGGCPEGSIYGEHVYDQYPLQCIPVAWHRMDPMEINESFDLRSRFGINSYPTGIIDRYRLQGSHYNPLYLYWLSHFNGRRNIPAIASVSMSNLWTDGNNFTADINVEFTSMPETNIPIKVNLLITEDSIAAVGTYEQTNYSQNVENGNNPLLNWKHNSVVRQAVGGTWGYSGVIPASVTLGTVYTKSVSFTIPSGQVVQYMHAIAYASYDLDTTNNHSQILNAESIRLEDFTSTGIIKPNSNSSVSIFPNPLHAGQTAGVSYELKKSSDVEITVTDAQGKIVSEPYLSYETAGRHTYFWSPLSSISQLPSGIYFVNLKLESESFTEKLLIE